VPTLYVNVFHHSALLGCEPQGNASAPAMIPADQEEGIAATTTSTEGPGSVKNLSFTAPEVLSSTYR
jgi:hypothetical protein